MKKDTNNKILAIIYSTQNKFLLLKTNPRTMRIEKWYVVTGSVKENETFRQAVEREVKEETKLEILKTNPTRLLFRYEWPKSSGVIKREKVFLVKVRHSEPRITKWEHLDYQWLSKKDFISKIYWFEGDKSELKELLNKI